MYQDIFIHPESAFVAIGLIVFIITLIVMNKSKILPKGARILIAGCIGLLSSYYMFRNDSFSNYESSSVFLLMIFIFSLLFFQFIFSKNEVSSGKSFFLSLALSIVIVVILSKFDFVLNWFEALQSIYVVIIALMTIGIVYLLMKRSRY